MFLWYRNSGLQTDARQATTNYTLTEKDVAGPFLRKLPSRMEAMKDIPKLSLTSAREGLAEKFHMSEQLLSMLNPKQHFDHAGDTIVVVDTTRGSASSPLKADRVEVGTSSLEIRTGIDFAARLVLLEKELAAENFDLFLC